MKPGVDIGDALAAVQYRCLAGQSAFADADVIVDFDFQCRAPLVGIEQAGQRAAHRGVGE